MLQIVISGNEYFDEESETFIKTKEQVLQLEHSLISVAKWEAKWKKPFLNKEPKTVDETIDYIRCMTTTQNINPLSYNDITEDILTQINAYIDDSMTATWFVKERNRRHNTEMVTSELIYYWMIALSIPFDPCQKWHLNRLLTLIQVCNVKNGPQKKMSKKEILANNRALNESRKQGLHTSG